MFGFKKSSTDARQASEPDRSKPIVRWMIRGDLVEVAAIEQASYQIPLSATGLAKAAASPRVRAYVVELEQQVVGYAFFEHAPRAIVVQRLAVSPVERRRGAGRLLLAFAARKLRRGPRNKLLAEVWERDLAGQLFLRGCGLRCELTIKAGYVAGPVVEDMYLFEWQA